MSQYCQFLVFMLRQKILKSKFNKPAKLSLSLDVRGINFFFQISSLVVRFADVSPRVSHVVAGASEKRLYSQASLHTELYKFAWKVSAKNLQTVHCTDLRLGQTVYLFNFYNI